MPLEELLRIGHPRRVVRWGEPILHQPARAVTDFGDDLQLLIADLFATNTAAEGAGLAAPQVGVDLAVFVYDCLNENWEVRRGVVCNPEVVLPEGRDRRLVEWEEGCLSLPGPTAPLARPDRARCHGQDQYGNDIEIAAGGVLGRCLQHESDHLRGLVFGDRLSRRKRRQLHDDFAAQARRYPDDWPARSSS